MRARQPDRDGYVERAGVKVFYEVFGDGAPTILLLPSWSVVHSLTWKMQVPYLARHYRVVTFDGRGNGRSGRPAGAGSYISAEYAADALAVLDATGTDRAVVVSLSRGASYALHLAAARPERVAGQIFICPTTPLAPFSPARLPFARRFEEALGSDAGWAKDNAHYWLRDYPGFLEFFFSQVFTEPHSTKQIEDGVSWGLETAPETLADTRRGAIRDARDDISPLLAAAGCPCLVIQGSRRRHRRARRRPGSWPTPWVRGPGWSSWPGRATRPMPATRSRSTSSSASSLTALQPGRAGRRPRRWTRGRQPRRSGPCTSPPPSGWATPAGMWPSPRNCAGCVPACRSTGWPSTR